MLIYNRNYYIYINIFKDTHEFKYTYINVSIYI